MRLSFTATLDRGEAQRRLERLLVPGQLDDPAVSRRIARLASDFQSYAGSYPLPLWSPGLVVTTEMRGATDALFPLAEIGSVFDLVLRRGCRFPPLLAGTYLHTSATWLDFLQRFRPQLNRVDPSATLRELTRDEGMRRDFLFALMLPHHFGGAFDRYPQQARWIRGWLRENRARVEGKIRVLDSACGSGEGTYDLAALVVEAGYGGEGCVVHGSTVEHIELFAAAHAFFPHDPDRERSYRAKVAGLFEEPRRPAIEFYLDDVASENGGEGGVYDLILCNGLLGGPIMHEERELAQAMASLASRLSSDGVLLAADHFHEGWKRRVPAERLRALMREHGLAPLELPEGVGGRRI